MVGIDGVIDLEVDYTTAKEVEGLKGLGECVWCVCVCLGGCG